MKSKNLGWNGRAARRYGMHAESWRGNLAENSHMEKKENVDKNHVEVGCGNGRRMWLAQLEFNGDMSISRAEA